MPPATTADRVRLNRVTSSYCRVALDNPPLNLMDADIVLRLREIVTVLENDDRVNVVVFESAVDGFFLNHSEWEMGVGLIPGGGPMARLPRVMGRGRALEVLLSADDIRGADAELLGYVNRALADAELDDFVDALANRIASFDRWTIANTKRLVNEASLPPDVEIRAGWDAFLASVKRPAGQRRIKALLEQGLQEPGEEEDRLGFYVGQLGPMGEH
jgi:enoyl-CoA hydratase/carnithine racemase